MKKVYLTALKFQWISDENEVYFKNMVAGIYFPWCAHVPVVPGLSCLARVSPW